jgi:hypothetical protein
MQPQGGGKTLGTRPAWKAFIRNRLPECCPVRAVFAHIISRLWLKAETMPMPGEDMLLFPGRTGDEMTLANHARIILALFLLVGVDPPKVTHEFRVFAAQALHEMGVTLEVGTPPGGGGGCGVCLCASARQAADTAHLHARG